MRDIVQPNLDTGREYPIPTSNVIKLFYNDQSGATCEFLVGANSSGASGTLVYTNSSPAMFVERGWSYAAVTKPSPTIPEPRWGKLRSRRISGTADGTEFVVQDFQDVYRVIFMSGSGKVHVLLDEHIEAYLTTPGTYFEVIPGQSTLGSALQVSSSPSVSQLVQEIQELAAS